VLSGENGYAADIHSIVTIEEAVTMQFVLRDCSQSITRDSFGRDAKVNIELNVRNNGNYHSATEHLYGWLLPLLMLLEVAVLVGLRREKEEEGDNWVKWLLKGSLWVSLAAVAFKFAGYALYAWVTGTDHQFFDFMYLLFHASSDSILIVLLMLLGFGWTVTFKNAQDFDLYVPLACMLGLVNVIMSLLNKVTDGDHDKYHMFDTIPAYIMFFFRLLGFAIFAFGIIRSLVKLKKEQAEFKGYFWQLAALGGIYLTFVPVGFLVVRLVEASWRKEAMYFGLEVGKFGLNVWLAVLSGWKKSAYRSIISRSFMEKEGKYF
jgi:hypothetical protein